MIKTTVMKKFSIIATILILASATAVAQKYAFVDTEYIRKNIPAFTTTQEHLDNISRL